MTCQPFSLSVRLTSLSLAMLRAIFFFQYARFALGTRHLRGCPCQKHPSTNTATLSLGNTKSGFPKSGYALRQPVILAFRSIDARTFSVDLFPADLTCAMIHERFWGLNVSILCYPSVGNWRVIKAPSNDNSCIVLQDNRKPNFFSAHAVCCIFFQFWIWV
jgi:hypothetical protein